MSHFFAYMARMKLIKRWGLMRNTNYENIQEHSLQVAMVAHVLAVILNKKYSGDVNVERVALLAIYHDANEVIIGDLATPIKYYNPEIKAAYKSIEAVANEKLLSMLPDYLLDEYQHLFLEQDADAELWRLIKAADKITAYLKCIEELKAGNQEFIKAADTIKKEIEINWFTLEVQEFFRLFVDSFSLTIDELN